jgi:cysteine dioxygenase
MVSQDIRSIKRIPQKLVPLVDYLDGLTARAPLAGLEERLRALPITVADVADYVRFKEDHYLRNLVSGGPWYHLLVICWRSGQRSPIHNHAESTCGLKVLRGIATETKFEMGPCELVKAVLSRDLPAGHVAASQDADMHQLSNLQVEGTDLITLHIYSPPLLQMRTFSLVDRSIGVFRPEIWEHGFGSGI